IVFLQAVDGIRYRNVTGVQTCALPIFFCHHIPVDIEGIRNMMAKDEVTEVHKSIFESSDRTIITAGRLHPDKDQKTLLKAFKKEIGRASCRDRVKIAARNEGVRRRQCK